MRVKFHGGPRDGELADVPDEFSRKPLRFCTGPEFVMPTSEGEDPGPPIARLLGGYEYKGDGYMLWKDNERFR